MNSSEDIEVAHVTTPQYVERQNCDTLPWATSNITKTVPFRQPWTRPAMSQTNRK